MIFRASTNNSGCNLRLLVDGTIAVNNIFIPQQGWTTFSDVAVPTTSRSRPRIRMRLLAKL